MLTCYIMNDHKILCLSIDDQIAGPLTNLISWSFLGFYVWFCSLTIIFLRVVICLNYVSSHHFKTLSEVWSTDICVLPGIWKQKLGLHIDSVNDFYLLSSYLMSGSYLRGSEQQPSCPAGTLTAEWSYRQSSFLLVLWP